MSDALMDDPITQQVIRNGLRSVANEMLLVVLRTAHQMILREGMDCSTALFDAKGRSIAQGLTLALHLGAMPDALASVLEKRGDDIHPGDVFAVNDPDEGGMHLPDVFVFQPVFADDRLLGFAGSVTHHLDVGGWVPGSIAPDSSDIFQEGLQIPVVKIRAGGEPCRDVLDLMTRNSRFPDTLIGDLNAQIAACRFGAQGLLSFADRHGREVLEHYLERILDSTEQLVRAEIAKTPDGTYRFSDYLDVDGFDCGPVEIRVAITVEGDHLIADFDGTSSQVAVSLNATESVVKAVVYTGVQCCIDLPDTAMDNSGAYRPIEVRVPEGTILNPCRPAARGSRGLTIFRATEAVFGALHGAFPDRVPAAGGGDLDMMLFTGTDLDGRLHVFFDSLIAGWGARSYCDGAEGASHILANTANHPVEVLEAEEPVLVEYSRLVPDTGGPGEFRGCLALERRYRPLLAEGHVHIRSDRRTHLSYGLGGGCPGTPSDSVLESVGACDHLPAMLRRHELRPGDVVVHRTAGGGGYGDPRRRDVVRVVADVRSGKVTPEHAREAYGVEVDLEAGTGRRLPP